MKKDGTSGKESTCQCRRPRLDPWGGEDPLEEDPAFFPRKSNGQRSLVGSSPWGHKESDTTEQACMKKTHDLLIKVALPLETSLLHLENHKGKSQ